MNLLLLLSALLSALTGVAGARVEPVPQAACVRMAQTCVAPAPRVAAARPVQPLPTLMAYRVDAAPIYRLAAMEPIFASRRRE